MVSMRAFSANLQKEKYGTSAEVSTPIWKNREVPSLAVLDGQLVRTPFDGGGRRWDENTTTTTDGQSTMRVTAAKGTLAHS